MSNTDDTKCQALRFILCPERLERRKMKIEYRHPEFGVWHLVWAALSERGEFSRSGSSSAGADAFCIRWPRRRSSKDPRAEKTRGKTPPCHKMAEAVEYFYDRTKKYCLSRQKRRPAANNRNEETRNGKEPS